ncbi:hypothetical protein MNBD_GAMMA04-1331 [hydrothermal vent metagenome]|uniref:Tlde1 domain-containing protein n=1 Tax=hydrothermal vent metagenome TaxID=652676 RepID=A0A3B0VZ93_9ZZZZ
MSWEYKQSSGELWRNGHKVSQGYSGKGSGKNNAAMEELVNTGPIPTGKYRIEFPRDSANTGPYVLPLFPVEHSAHGRTHFQIHGDSIKSPGTASSGCIIMPRSIRERIWSSGDKELNVVK